MTPYPGLVADCVAEESGLVAGPSITYQFRRVVVPCARGGETTLRTLPLQVRVATDRLGVDVQAMLAMRPWTVPVSVEDCEYAHEVTVPAEEIRHCETLLLEEHHSAPFAAGVATGALVTLVLVSAYAAGAALPTLLGLALLCLLGVVTVLDVGVLSGAYRDHDVVVRMEAPAKKVTTKVPVKVTRVERYYVDPFVHPFPDSSTHVRVAGGRDSSGLVYNPETGDSAHYSQYMSNYFTDRDFQ